MMIDEVPPQSIEIEQSILSACLLDPASVETATDILSPGDFYNTPNQLVFSAICALYTNKIPVDAPSVMEKLRDRRELDKAGGGVYLGKLLDDVPMAINAEHNSNIVKRKSIARSMIEKCYTAIQACFSAEDSEILDEIDRAQAGILKVGMNMEAAKFATMEEMAVEATDRYELLNEGKRRHGVMTGFHSIDLCTGGLYGSKLVIVAARPRMGKTALMLNMASNMAKRGHTVGIFSIEMDKERTVRQNNVIFYRDQFHATAERHGPNKRRLAQDI